MALDWQSIHIHESKELPDEQAVRTFVEYTSVEAAQTARAQFNGRYFDERMTVAKFYEERSYANRNYEIQF